MKYFNLQFMPERKHINLECFVNELKGGPRPAMLVIPGGGYHNLCSDREGAPIALAYYTRGFNAFVLSYSVDKQIDTPFRPLEEASRAIIYIRQHAAELDIDPNRVYAVGFSAGGHLAAALGTMWDDEEIKAMLPDKGCLNKPNAVVLCYAVTNDLTEKQTNKSFINLYGGSYTESQAKRLSPTEYADASSAPAFIFHTVDDEKVPVRSALLMAEAYAAANIRFELHIYPRARHGAALANETTWLQIPELNNPRMARWVSDSIDFLKELK